MHAPRWLDSSVSTIENAAVLDRLAGPMKAVTRILSRGRSGEALRGEWLGHALHPLATDVPLGCWISSGLLDIVAKHRAADASRQLVGIGLMFVPLTAASGLADWNELSSPRRRRVGLVHALGNGLVAVLYLLSWQRRRSGEHQRGVAYGLAGGTLAIVTGYLGGHLSFATGANVEPRGLSGDHEQPVDQSGHDFISLADAAGELGVTLDRVRVMVDEGLLVTATVHDEPQVRRSDLIAVRMQGG